MRLNHEFLRLKEAKRKRNELSLEPGIKILERFDSPMIKTAAEDLREFMEKSLQVAAETDAVSLIIKKNKHGSKYDYCLKVDKTGMILTGATEWGIARGLYCLQSLLKMRRAPYLRTGVYDNEKSLEPALSYPAFKSASTTSLDFPRAYDKKYLLTMARAGYTGFHLNLDISIFIQSEILPELNCSQADTRFEELRQVIAIARECALEVYISIYQHPYSGDHPVYVNHPDAKGSPSVFNADTFVMCSSSRKTRMFYREQFRRIFMEAEGLAGVILICGCEGWLHCHTVCARDDSGRCICPNCGKIKPEKSVGEMLSDIGAAVKSVDREARCIVWTYGIFAWSDPAAATLISYLSRDCEVMANFDTGDDFKLFGAAGTRFDYSLSAVGPSKPFEVMVRKAEKRKLKYHTKCENASPLEFPSVQYVPAMTRWLRKYENIRQSGVAGALFNWKFIGYTGAPSAELAGLISFGESEEILIKMADRDFGVENRKNIMRIWRNFDRGMDFHPFSLGTAGYFRGPLFIGFAHPLILDITDIMELPAEFFEGKRCFVFPDLNFVQPFGVKACLKAFKRQEHYWSQAVTLSNSLIIPPNDPWVEKKIKAHQNLSRALLCMVRTAVNLIEFYEVRDSFYLKPLELNAIQEKIEKLREIAIRELQNTRDGLKAIQNNPEIYFSQSYRYGISESMCRYKIKYMEKLIDYGIPRRLYATLFSRNRKPYWLQ